MVSEDYFEAKPFVPEGQDDSSQYEVPGIGKIGDPCRRYGVIRSVRVSFADCSRTGANP